MVYILQNNPLPWGGGEGGRGKLFIKGENIEKVEEQKEVKVKEK